MVEATSRVAETVSGPNRAALSRSPATPSGLGWFKYIFDSSIAETAEERQSCLRVRFQVYCVDNQLEDPQQNPGGFEIDAFDHQSVHSLLTHRASGTAIGTARLVLPYSSFERRSLPIELLLANQPLPFPVERTAEVSRFAIAKDVHQYTPTSGIETALPREEWRKALAHLPLGLLKSCLEMSAREGITHVAAVLEPSLLRLLRRFGIRLNLLGGLVEYHGLRQPCWAEIDVLLASLQQERPEIWKLVTDDGRLWPSTGNTASH